MIEININNLWVKYKKTSKLVFKNKLIEYYYPLISKVAVGIYNKIDRKVSLEELISYGVDGLYDAIDKFNLKRGNKFETYASFRIYGAILDAIRVNDWVPRSVRLRNSKINNIKEKLEHEIGKIDEVELVEKAGFNQREYYKKPSKFMPINVISIESLANKSQGNDDNFSRDLNPFIKCANNNTPDSKLLRQEFINKLIGKNFTARERKIVYYFFYENLSSTQVGEKIGLSGARVSQILDDIIVRLRKRIQLNPSYFDDIINIINSCNDKESLL
ncbi:MAG: sigma-70 family RNA polymerase sigma factor [Phenylobacterium sp.]